jgi:hypothetical protein
MSVSIYGSGNTIIKITSFASNTRTVLSSSASASTINTLWTVSVTKIDSTSNFIAYGVLQGYTPYNGGATWFFRINGGSWISGGVHSYNTAAYGTVDSLQCYIPASSLAAGTYNIDIGWASNVGRPFNTWNPNSTDSSTELYYPSYSQLTINEISG